MQPQRNRFAFGPSVPAPIVVEHHGETAWDAFEREVKRQDRQFADTLPPDEAPPPSQLASCLVQVRATDEPPALPSVDLVQALAVARKGNRVCPKPQVWFAIYGTLKDAARSRGVEPPPPIPLESWAATSKMAKRMAFRDHVEWADRLGELPRMFAHMESLDESSWHHW
jgi:hypothetical protein